MKVLVIGNNGFIGSLLTEKMMLEHEVVGVDLCWFGQDLGHSINCDLGSLDQGFVRGFDAIVNLAAHSSVSMSIADPAGAVRNNVVNLNRLMQMMSAEQRLIYASSASIYSGLDAREDQCSYTMSNPYDTSKQIADDIARGYIADGKQIVGLRFGTVCGISPNTRTDLAINNMLLSATKVGKFWIADGHLHRSWLAVQDAVDAIIAIVTSEAFHPGIYNLKSFDSTISDVAIAINRITGYEYVIKNSMHSDYDFTINDDLFRTTFDWHPNYDLNRLIKHIDQGIVDVAECRRDSLGEGRGGEIR